MRNLMVRLAHPMLRLLGRDERGAIGVMIALLISGGVLLGMGALTIDVGRLYQNRAELQNGADAAALAVARTCASGTCVPSAASNYADLNASKLTSRMAAVDLVCGSVTLGACPASTGALTDCPAAPSGGANYVDVHTSTMTPSGPLLPPAFARTLLGHSSYSGSTVYACAQAEWGAALNANTLGITLSICQWDSLTSGGGNPFGTEIALVIKGKAKPCAGPAGQNIPGGFDWLVPQGSTTCTAIIDLTTSTTYSNPGNDVPTGCAAVIQQYVASGTVLYIPVFDSSSGTGANATYHIAGLAAFVLNGYENLPGVHPDVVPNGMAGQCYPSSAVCLFGYFTQALVPLTDLVGAGTDFGATAIKLSG